MKINHLVIGLLLGSAVLSADAPYELLLQGGHVLDPKNNVNATMDVAIADGKVALVAPDIDPILARQVVDVSGFYVTPGLVDIHVHVYAGTGMRGQFGFLDVRNGRFKGDKLIVAEMTVHDGRVVWDLNARSSPDWMTYYRNQLRARFRGRGRRTGQRQGGTAIPASPTTR